MYGGPPSNQYSRYGAPPPNYGPPPNQYQSYGPPPGPPSGNGYRPPPGPPSGGYNAPSGPPPRPARTSASNNYQRPQAPPPMQVQNYGGFQYQYSQCNGRRKALLVGINYFGSKNQLRGCINDVKNMSQFLTSNYGYRWEDMVILTDDQTDMARIPTRENILRAMQWLVRDAQPNDSLFFHYSGHGGRTKDLDGDEESGYDDVIYPVDFEYVGHIVDDIMHDIMVRPLMPGVRLTALYDSCHSGTALDLPFVYSTKGVVKEPSMLKTAGSGVMGAVSNYARGDLFGAVSSLGGIMNSFGGGSQTNRQSVIQWKASPADVISISGCKDDQTSADSNEGGMNTGAMSWSFIAILSQQPTQSYLSLLNNMRGLLYAKYTQKPQLSSSHPIDMNLKFLL